MRGPNHRNRTAVRRHYMVAWLVGTLCNLLLTGTPLLQVIMLVLVLSLAFVIGSSVQAAPGSSGELWVDGGTYTDCSDCLFCSECDMYLKVWVNGISMGQTAVVSDNNSPTTVELDSPTRLHIHDRGRAH